MQARLDDRVGEVKILVAAADVTDREQVTRSWWCVRKEFSCVSAMDLDALSLCSRAALGIIGITAALLSVAVGGLAYRLLVLQPRS